MICICRGRIIENCGEKANGNTSSRVECAIQFNGTQNIPLEFPRFFFHFSYIFYCLFSSFLLLLFFIARLAPQSLRLQSFSRAPSVCVFSRVSPANVTVMLTGVAHEAIHLLQLELRLAAAAPSAAAARQKRSFWCKIAASTLRLH